MAIVRETTRPLPEGTVTFLFTDVEGSTRLWERHHAAMRVALAEHDALIEVLAEQHGGQVVRPRGASPRREGDSRFCVFVRATDAVAGQDLPYQVAMPLQEVTEPRRAERRRHARRALDVGEQERERAAGRRGSRRPVAWLSLRRGHPPLNRGAAPSWS